MNVHLLDILACPDCRGDLTPSRCSSSRGRSEEEIQEGTLTCVECRASYQVTRGIPRFDGDYSNSVVSTAGHFEREFTKLSAEDRDIEPPEMAEYYFFTRSALDPKVFDVFSNDYFRTDLSGPTAYEADYSSIEGKVVLDAGCGAGRFTRVVGNKARLAVGLELGGYVDRAARLCDGIDDVEFVQGSILKPPFKKGIFDLVFSLGVLHHTPDPRGGCLRLADLVSDDGLLSVWVYPPEYWNGPVRGPVARLMNRFVSRLPGSAAHWFCARMLYPLGRLQGFLARRRWSKFLFAPFSSCPPLVTRSAR